MNRKKVAHLGAESLEHFTRNLHNTEIVGFIQEFFIFDFKVGYYLYVPIFTIFGTAPRQSTLSAISPGRNKA